MPRPQKRKYTRHFDRFDDGYAFSLSPEIKRSILIIAFIKFINASFRASLIWGNWNALG